MEKSADAFRTISEVAEELKLPQHVLRFWETRFPQIRPMKRGGNRRFYRPDDIELLLAIKTLLYADGFTIKGVQRILKERGPRAVARLAQTHGEDSRDTLTPLACSEEDAEAMNDDFEEQVRGSLEGKLPVSDDSTLSAGILDRLQAVLFELSECRRILTAVRD